ERMSVHFSCSDVQTEKLLNAVMPQLATQLQEKAFVIDTLGVKTTAAASTKSTQPVVPPSFEAKA
ncbi:hypothetical protein N9872_03200, partial [Paraglaciecola sp.]